GDGDGVHVGDMRVRQYRSGKAWGAIIPVVPPDHEEKVEEPTLKLALDLDDETTEVDATLFEYNHPQRTFRLERYPTKAKLLERMDKVARRLEELKPDLLREGMEPDDLFSMGGNVPSIMGAGSQGVAIGGWMNDEYLP